MQPTESAAGADWIPSRTSPPKAAKYKTAQAPRRSTPPPVETVTVEEAGEVLPEADDFAVEPAQSRAVRGAAHAAPRYSGGCPDCGGGTCEDGCAPCDEGYESVCGPLGYPCHPFWQRFHDRFWFRAEYLMWWTSGMGVPPLLTSSPTGTPQEQAGVIGQPGTTILFGGEGLNRDLRSGARLSFGMWFDACQNVGVEFDYLGLGEDVERYNTTSQGDPILSRPFINAETGLRDAQLVAFPGVLSDHFGTIASSEFQRGGVALRRALCRSCDYRIDLVTGYRYLRLRDNLHITENLTTIDGAAGDGTRIDLFDDFDTQNDFHGGEIGVATQRQWCRWSFETRMKLAVGNTRSRTRINGATTVTPVEGQAETFPGGFLALPSNMGEHETSQFSVVPELGITVGYAVSPRLRATFGYTLLYWSNVTRAGDQIDTSVSPSLLPPAEGTGFVHPEFQRRPSDYWAQGLNLGLDMRF